MNEDEDDEDDEGDEDEHTFGDNAFHTHHSREVACHQLARSHSISSKTSFNTNCEVHLH